MSSSLVKTAPLFICSIIILLLSTQTYAQKPAQAQPQSKAQTAKETAPSKAPSQKAAPVDRAKDRAKEEPVVDDAQSDAEIIPEVAGTSGPSVSIDDRIIMGERAYSRKNFKNAVFNFYMAYKSSETGSEEKETSEYYLAKSFMNLGLTYAASEFFYEIIKSGSNVDRIADSLYILQDVMENSPYDENLIKNDLVYNVEYGFLSGELLDFINYYKGEVNFKKKLYKWANKRFSLLSRNSYYFNKVRFLRGIQILALGRTKNAMKIFEEIIEDRFQDFNVKNKARQTMARLFYEQKKYDEAHKLYTQIDSDVLDQDSAFLEKAWSLYFLKRYQEALGALNPLWSPRSKERFFYPEKYILKALILRSLCQFEDAKAVVIDFQNEYGKAIDTILNREDPMNNRVLVNAALWDVEVRSKTAFIEQLKTEEKKLSSIGGGWEKIGLKDFLKNIYRLKLEEMQRHVENDLLDRFKKVSNSLLTHYEQVRILEYELSLDELSRLKRPPLDVEKVESIPLIYKNTIYWPFNGEFWTDELLLYKNLIENRCGRRS